MRVIKLTLLIFLIILGTNHTFASQGALKWKPTTTDTLLNKANMQPSVSSPYGEILNDPMINSAINGYANMIQGATGGTYNSVERERLQTDYAKQQTNNDGQE